MVLDDPLMGMENIEMNSYYNIKSKFIIDGINKLSDFSQRNSLLNFYLKIEEEKKNYCDTQLKKDITVKDCEYYKSAFNQFKKVISFISSQLELYPNDETVVKKNVKKGDLGSAQNLTYGLMTMILKLASNETNFDTSKLRDFIHTIIGKSEENIKKCVDNYKTAFLPHLKENSKMALNRNQKKSLKDALILTKKIFDSINLKIISDELSDNIERLDREIQR